MYTPLSSSSVVASSVFGLLGGDLGLPRGESLLELVKDATRLDSFDSLWASRSSLRYSSTEVNGNGVVLSGLFGHVFVVDDNSIHDSPNKSSLFLGVADILFVSLAKLIDLNILCISLSGMYKGIPNWSTGRYPMLADARKQAKNQFSRFTIFVNKGSEGVRETRQAPKAVFLATSNRERWINKTQIQVHSRSTRSLLWNSHSPSLALLFTSIQYFFAG